MSAESDKLESGKITLPVTGLFGELSVSQDLDSHVITDKLMTSDANLSMKSIINCPEDLTILGLLAKDAEQEQMPDIAELYTTFLREFRENSCSKDGARSKQVERMVVANVAKSEAESQGMQERLIGRSRK